MVARVVCDPVVPRFLFRGLRGEQSGVLPYYMSKMVVEASWRTLNPKPSTLIHTS